MVRPEGLLPFKVDRNSAVQKFREWLGSLWFRPNDLKSKSSVANIRGVYIPFWTFDSATHSSWTAEAGHYYYVDVDVIENGRSVTKQERRTRWEPASGFLEKFFDDVPVTASRGLEADLCREIEPFPTAELVPYTPDYLSGFLAEENAVPLEEGLESAKGRMRREIAAECERQVPGDTNRNLQVHSTFSALAYKNALLPIWIAAYIYGGKSFLFLVNGVTGKVSGHAPISWVKVSLVILVVLAILAIIFMANGSSG